jgi:N-acyl-phosphatidylethanolamine-hydrolysing phospholipase D
MLHRLRIVGLAAALALAAPPPRSIGAFEHAPRDTEGRFINLAGSIAYAGPLIAAPFFMRRALTTIVGRADAPPRRENDGAFLRRNAGHSVPTVTWIGHATVLVQMGHATFLTDPTWSGTASPLRWLGPRRFVAPGVALDALPPIDFVVISHNHYDHLDLPTLQALAARRPATRFYVPAGNGALLREAGIVRVHELDWGDTASEGALTIHCLPAQHWSQRGLGDRREALWASWAVTGGGRRLYFGGDSGYAPHFEAIGRALGPFDLAALPIGAYEPHAMMAPWHLNPEEAVRAGNDLRASRLFGMHFGTFDLSDEPLAEPARRFRAAGATADREPDQLWLLDVGETRPF